MRNKNTIIFLLVVFVAICFYNLYWTYVQYSSDAQVKPLRDAYGVVQEKIRADTIPLTQEDSSTIQSYEAILADSEFQKKYKASTKNSFTLGLDLQGGMFVTLAVGVDEVIRQLASDPSDTTLLAAIECAKEREKTAQTNFVPLFVECFREIAPGEKLGARFANPVRGISFTTDDGEVIQMLEEEANGAIDNTLNIIRTRIDQFGVVSPTLQKQESTGRILLELPGVREPERVRKLLRSTAKMEFWTTHKFADAYRTIYDINERLKLSDSTYLAFVNANAQADSSGAVGDSAVAVVDSLADLTEAADSNDLEGFSTEDVVENDPSSLTEDQEMQQFGPLGMLLNMPLELQNIPSDYTYPGVASAAAQDTAKINKYLQDPEIQLLIPDNMVFAWSFKPIDEDGERFELIALKNMVLGGDKISRASQDYNEAQQPAVSMQMNIEGARDWGRITENNVGKHVAIVLDKAVYSFPVIRGKIPNGNSTIEGGFSLEEATDLANVLKAGQLPVPARIEGEDVVGPSLGEQNIQSGWQSFLFAFALTLIFMAVYYARAGLVANVALIANVIFILGCSAAFTIVLTLPGMAAVVLTIGMAVDANVLIFERIREEQSRGKTLKASIKSGFSNAFSSVMDANITTFLTGVVLYSAGVGPIRGFAVSLMIGIITSLISALVITRLILDYYANQGKTSINFGFPFTTGLFDKIKLNMVGRRKTFYGISGTLVVASIVLLLTVGLKTGVDFKGGRQFEVEFYEKGKSVPAPLSSTDVETIRQDLRAAFGNEEPIIKTLRSDNKLQITTSYLSTDREATGQLEELMKGGLQQNYSKFDQKVVSSTDVGPMVASDIRKAAYQSVIFSLLIIFLYILIRFRRWQYSLGAIVAIFHDVLIVLGIFSLLSLVDLPFNIEVNQALIAALLTIIGYSINDTVVVFDRIRENIGEMKSIPLPDVYNISIDQTISRTLITSVTTLLTALILFSLGGDAIRGFTFAIILGVIVGTYSSVFVASPISLDLISLDKNKPQEVEKENPSVQAVADTAAKGENKAPQKHNRPNSRSKRKNRKS